MSLDDDLKGFGNLRVNQETIDQISKREDLEVLVSEVIRNNPGLEKLYSGAVSGQNGTERAEYIARTILAIYLETLKSPRPQESY